jgi:hypothetical protein
VHRRYDPIRTGMGSPSRGRRRPTGVCAVQCLCGAPRRNRTGDPILTMEPPGTAVRTAVPPAHARPSGQKLTVLFRRSYVLSFNYVLVVNGGEPESAPRDTNLALSSAQSWCAGRANPHLQPARMRGQIRASMLASANAIRPLAHVWPRHMPELHHFSRRRSGELELGWRSRSSGEGWAGSSCRRGSRRFSPPGSHQFQWRAASWPPGPARSGPGWRPGAWPQPGRPISLNETGRLDRECAEHGDRSMAATRDPHPTRTRLAGA